MAKKEQNLKTFLTGYLRKLSYQWKNRKYAQANARVSRGKYKCAECTRQGIDRLWGPKDISLDHITPIVPLSGWDTWDGYLTRLFCNVEGFQVLCNQHHDEKTARENEVRKKTRQIKKKLDSDDEI